jgi:hypothetical protein
MTEQEQLIKEIREPPKKYAKGWDDRFLHATRL